MKTVTYDDAAWVLVPIEPTLEMKVGGNQELSAWVAPAMHSVDAWRAMLKAAPIPTAQIQPDAIPSFDELERRYFPKGRKERLEWEAEQRALTWHGSTPDAKAQLSVRDAALEEAAAQCEDIYSWPGAVAAGVMYRGTQAACAAAIRALKSGPHQLNLDLQERD